MVELPGSLACLFSATVERRGDSYVLEVPAREVDLGSIESGGQYRVGVITAPGADQQAASASAADEERDRDGTVTAAEGRDRSGVGSPAQSDPPSGPPVDEDETRTVTIESVGDEGDGIAKVERGYVIIVDGASVGETVRIRVHTVTRNVAFADVVDRDPTHSH